MSDTLFKVTCSKCGKVFHIAYSTEEIKCECGLNLVLCIDEDDAGEVI